MRCGEARAAAAQPRRPTPPRPRRLPVNTRTPRSWPRSTTLATSVYLKRATRELGLDVEISKAEFAKLVMAVGNTTDHTVGGGAGGDDGEAMLHCLRMRLEKKMIFTAIGPVLVVCNPYEPVRPALRSRSRASPRRCRAPPRPHPLPRAPPPAPLTPRRFGGAVERRQHPARGASLLQDPRHRLPPHEGEHARRWRPVHPGT